MKKSNKIMNFAIVSMMAVNMTPTNVQAIAKQPVTPTLDVGATKAKQEEKVTITFVFNNEKGWILNANWDIVGTTIQVKKGEKVKFCAMPKDDYLLKNITIDGQEYTTKEEFDITPQSDMTVTVNFVDQIHTIQLSPATVDFGIVPSNYDRSEAKIIAVKNTGNSSFMLAAPTSTKNFYVSTFNRENVLNPSENYSTISIEIGETIWFSVDPKLGLAPGTYEDEIPIYELLPKPMSLSDDTVAPTPLAKLKVKFTVQPATPVVEKFEVTTTASPAEGGTTTGAGTYEKGDLVTVTATPNEGYEFVEWTENGELACDANELSFTITEDSNLVAVFKKKAPVVEKFEVTTTASPAEGGTTTGDGTYNKNQLVKLKATPKEGYEFVCWKENDEIIMDVDEFFLQVLHDTNVVAVFKKKAPAVEKFEVNTSSSPLEGGTTTGDGTYDKGKTVKVTATPKEGYEFVSWMEDGQTVSSTKELSFTVTKERNLLAVFKKKAPAVEKFEVNTSSSPLEGGTTTGDGTYKKNTFLQVTASPKEGYEFVHWKEKDYVITDKKEFNLLVTHDSNLVAVFKKKAPAVEKFKVATSSSPLEGGTTTGDGTYDKGKTVKVTATPKEGYEFVSWMEDGQTVSKNKELSFTVTKERNLLAVFAKKEVPPVAEKFTVATNATPKEGGATKGAGMYKANETVSVIAQAKSGYQFIHWLEDGKVVSLDATFTFKATKDRNLVAVFEKKAKVPTALSTNVFTWIGLAGLSSVAGMIAFKKKQKK